MRPRHELGFPPYNIVPMYTVTYSRVPEFQSSDMWATYKNCWAERNFVEPTRALHSRFWINVVRYYY